MLLGLALHVLLLFDPAPHMPAAAVDAAIAEAARIWAPYGVVIAAGTGQESLPRAGTAVLTVTPRRAPTQASADDGHGLGALDFTRSGRALPHVTVDYAGLRRLVRGLAAFGKRAPQWPAALHNQVIGRVLGRILAHEIGHYLLGSGHAPAGLMRARHSIAELAAPQEVDYRLEGIEPLRLLRAVEAPDGPGH